MLTQTLAGRYQIINRLGGGGFGSTFVAEDTQLPGNPRCVVKQLKPQATDPLTLHAARRLFDTEAQVLYQLGTHDQIPRLLAYFEENQEFYLVQELIEGHDLSEELTPSTPNNPPSPPLSRGGVQGGKSKGGSPRGGVQGGARGGRLSEEEVISLLRDILEILEFVHQQKIIHRDVNPRNILRRERDGKLVLIDFGAVKQVTTQVVNPPGKTNITVAIGTPGYVPSEQAHGNPKLSSDIYAVGIIGIQALTGLTPDQLLKDADTDEIMWHDQAQVNPELAQILDKMVRYDFRQRYPSASVALQAVKELTNPVSRTVVLPTPSPKNPAIPKKTTKSSSRIHKALISTGLVGLGLAATVFIVNTFNYSNASELYTKANTLYELKRYKEAFEAYDKAIQINPEYPEAWNGQGNTLYELKQYEEALEAYDKAIQIQPEYLEAWSHRAFVLNDLQRYEEAIDSFDKTLNIKQDYPEVWNGRGDALIKLQQYEEAIESYEKAIEFKEDYYQAWNSRGWAMHNLQRYEDAIAAYEKAIEYKSDYSEAWYNRGNALINLQRYDQAIESYDKAVQFNPDYYQAWFSRGNALVKKERYLEAIESFEKTVQLKPNYYKAWYSHGWSLHQLQRYEEAIESYDKAIQLKRDDYQIWYNRGNALYNLKRYEDAIASYNKTIRYKPDHYEAWYSKGNALFYLQQYEDAIASYDKAVQYKPDYREAIEARDQIKQRQRQLLLQKLKRNELGARD